MKTYSVETVSGTAELGRKLNYWAAHGWELHTIFRVTSEPQYAAHHGQAYQLAGGSYYEVVLQKEEKGPK